MRIRRVLVVYKKSSYDIYANVRKDPHFLRAMRKKSPGTGRFLSSHQRHQRSLAEVQEVLLARGIRTTYVFRSEPFRERGYDLVLTVGGDGTFLEASHQVEHAPMLGINSSPADSVGIFCGITSDRLEWTLRRIERGEMKPIPLTRLRVSVNGRPLHVPILNDLLVAHVNPAATSRYVLKARGRREEQKSSGFWIATPVGSTAGIGSAGGRFLPAGSKSFQYRVRELYVPPGARHRMEGGLLRHAEKLTVWSRMRAGRLYLDGPHLTELFPIGAKAEITATAPKLRVFSFNEKRRAKF